MSSKRFDPSISHPRPVPRASAQPQNGFVPLAEMFGYATTLRSMSQGRATYTMEFHHFAEAPRNVADEIISKRAK